MTAATPPCSLCSCSALVGGSEARFCSDCGHSREDHGYREIAPTADPVSTAPTLKRKKGRRGLLVGLALALVALFVGGGVLVLVTQADSGPTISGTTPEAEETARLLVEDADAPPDIASVSCSKNTDPWAETGFSPFRCEVSTQAGSYTCDAGETLSEGHTLACDEQSHYEAIKNETLALAQGALDVINQDSYYAAYVSRIADEVRVGTSPLCKVLRSYDAGRLGDVINVSLFSFSTPQFGLGVEFIVQDGRIGFSPYAGQPREDSLESPKWWAVGTCEVTGSGITFDHWITPGKTALLDVGVSAPIPGSGSPDGSGTSIGGDDESNDAAREVARGLVSDLLTIPAIGTDGHDAIVHSCYSAADQAKLDSGRAINRVSWERGCRAGAEDAIYESATLPAPVHAGFVDPSGNIECVARFAEVSGDPSSLDCIVHSERKSWSLPAYGGEPRRLKQWSNPYGRQLRELSHGERWSLVINCVSEEQGITCRNGAGKGFFLSREMQMMLLAS